MTGTLEPPRVRSGLVIELVEDLVEEAVGTVLERKRAASQQLAGVLHAMLELLVDVKARRR